MSTSQRIKPALFVLLGAVLTMVVSLPWWSWHQGGTPGAGQADEWVWRLPAGFPVPMVPASNPMSKAKVELGRFLFYDRRLSGNGTQSCASCHQQDKAFTDGRKVGIGSTGEHHVRNAQGLVNSAYHPTLTWANYSLLSLEAQLQVPVFGDRPVELGVDDSNFEAVIARIRADERYAAMFAAAFPGITEPVSWGNVSRAIAAFQRTMISGRSRFDQYLQGQARLSPSELRGFELFNSPQTDCFRCHGGVNFSDQVVHAGSLSAHKPFHNVGLYNVQGTGAYPDGNQGLFEISERAQDRGKFRTPSLRNVEVTGPYMHDGSVATLTEAVELFARGGRHVTTGPHAGDGRTNPYKSEFIKARDLSPRDIADLVAFLKTLTDHEFLNDPQFSDPFGHQP